MQIVINEIITFRINYAAIFHQYTALLYTCPFFIQRIIILVLVILVWAFWNRLLLLWYKMLHVTGKLNATFLTNPHFLSLIILWGLKHLVLSSGTYVFFLFFFKTVFNILLKTALTILDVKTAQKTNLSTCITPIWIDFSNLK